MKKRWTFNGIKRFAPGLSLDEWFCICKNGLHHNKMWWEVIGREKPGEPGKTG